MPPPTSPSPTHVARAMLASEKRGAQAATQGRAVAPDEAAAAARTTQPAAVARVEQATALVVREARAAARVVREARAAARVGPAAQPAARREIPPTRAVVKPATLRSTLT